MLEKLFKLSENGTNVRTEMLAGVTTFLTMVYILAVNPAILSITGMPKEALFTATAVATVLGTLFMAFCSNLPVAAAPGMGLNAFFAFTIVKGMGYSWQMGLTAVFIEGIIFIFLTYFNIREMIVNAIPVSIKNAIPVGIGLFIALIGLQSSGLIVDHPATLVTLADLKSPNVLILSVGILVTGTFIILKKDWAILAGILSGTLLGIILDVVQLPSNGILSLPPDMSPIFAQFEWAHVFTLDMAIIVGTLLFVNLFDTIGTLVAVATKAGLIKPDGSFPQIKKALFGDALGTTAGAVLGVSTVTSYIESASGVAAGGRTGLTAVSTAIMFSIALFFAPLFLIVPAAATAPALIIVGLFMISTVTSVNFDDFSESIPAFLTIVIMPFSYSIAHGIVFGMLSYTFIKLASGRHRDISVTMYIISLVMLLKVLFS